MDALQQFGEQLMKEMQAVVPKVTGKTAESIEYVPTERGFDIVADEHIVTLIDGRGPTKNGRGEGPTLREKILSWITAKRIVAKPMQNGKVPTAEQLSWMISSKIHKEGNKLFRSGGGNDIFDTIITESRIDAFLESLLSERATKIESDFLTVFKNNGARIK